MDEAYRRLAAALDAFPHGFPATESGVELRILEHIFTPDEAALAAAMLPVPERVEAIARRTGRPVDPLRGQLEAMAAKGQVLAVPRPGGMRYALVPFVVGIYEFQLPRMDRALAELVEEYFPTLMKSLGGHRPGMARVVPVGVHIDAPPAVLRYESVRAILDDGGSFRVMPCLCRKEKAALGSPCSHTAETCLAISPDPEGLQDFPSWGRRIEREEALALLDRFEREGLVHCTYNVRTQPMFICNCCPCCCGFLRGITEFEAPNFLIRSNWVAHVEAGECLACGTCVERCPTHAIVERDDAVAVTDERCIGCGVCVVTCAGSALRLAARPEAERTTPPASVPAWAFQRAAARQGRLRTAAQFGGIAAKAAWSEFSARRPGSRTGATPP